MSALTLETDRLLLRPWREADADVLFRWASNPRIGPPAGWPAHTSAEHSREVIRTVLSAAETYAVVLKTGGNPIGSVSIQRCTAQTGAAPEEPELGCWIAAPYWGQGLIPEALECLLQRSFQELGCPAVWYCWYDGNGNSQRVQEKLGFFFHHTEENHPLPLLGETRTAHYARLTRQEWEQRPILPLRFRDAAEADYDVVFSYVERLWTYNTYDKASLRAVYRRVLEDPNSFAFLVEDGDGVFHGLCHGAFFPTFWLSGETCYVSSLITNEEDRGRGYGRHLLDHARELSRRRGCKGMVLDSGFPRTEAHRFYKQYGFEKSCYGFDLTLP